MSLRFYSQSVVAGVRYYHPPENSMCPYWTPDVDYIANAPRPFFGFGIRLGSAIGVPTIAARNAIIDSRLPIPAKLTTLLRKAEQAGVTTRTEVVEAESMTIERIRELGGAHFDMVGIDTHDIAAFLRFANGRKMVIVEARSGDAIVFRDLSVTGEGELHGIFCDWNRAYAKLSPGALACACAYNAGVELGMPRYNIGWEYPYKLSLANCFEETLAVGFCGAEFDGVNDFENPAAHIPAELLNKMCP